ncbi:MAG TPA: polysaccharide deacetylase family protein [Cyclobacteriaceae bacterium]|nr:polysaccharide deacetylase family protein [Cyclobacteriaceae bacterium]HRF34401.1 polysaccharide deacetylase family protein [Cyclobacteriaceae bacterium]
MIGLAYRRLVYALLFVMGCTPQDRYAHAVAARGGVCISFDDRSVNEWFALREMLLKYDARVTFFVTQWDSLSPDEKDKLHILQDDGHEIGFHGVRHLLSEYYIKEHSLKKYMTDEIVPGIQAMNKDGFYPTSFAYPYSAKYWFTDRELLKYFYVLRSEAIPQEGELPANVDAAFYDYEGKRLTYALSLENKSLWTDTELNRALDRAADENEVLVLYGHVPGATTDLKLLEDVLRQASQRNLKFLRVSDLVISNSEYKLEKKEMISLTHN